MFTGLSVLAIIHVSSGAIEEGERLEAPFYAKQICVYFAKMSVITIL